MDSRARELVKQGNALFDKRSSLVTLWQVIAEQFRPERADFTASISDIALAEHLFTSYPVLACRELGNVFAAMLRPRSARWFSTHVQDKQADEKDSTRAYLEFVDDVMWRAMYDPAANFVRATKEADQDYATFGNAIIQPEVDFAGTHLLFRCHHIRDHAWSENANGKVDLTHGKRKWSARQIMGLFPKTASKEVQKAFGLDPEAEFECRHIVVPTRVYRPDSTAANPKFTFTSLYVETESETVLEERPRRRFGYVIPRWQTISGSQYARSPATEPVLPDARTMQSVIRTLREAAEKHVDPPMVAVSEALRSDIYLQAGGITFADAEYDERSGEVLRPVDSNPGTMPIGTEIALALREDIRNGLFLDKMALPQADLSKMPVYSVRRLLEEQIRAQAPLFEPVEQEYSAPLCEETFEMLRDVGAFGPAENVPPELRGQDIQFTFQSPLRDIADTAEAQQFMDGMGLVERAAAHDPAQLKNVNLTKSLRDGLKGVGWKQDWLNSEDQVTAAQKQLMAQQNMQRGAAAIGQGAEIAKVAAEAANQAGQAGV